MLGVFRLIVVGLAAWPGWSGAAAPDCRECHHGGDSGATRDVAAYYAEPGRHHPVGRAYPDSPDAISAYARPTGRAGGIVFFDANGNSTLEVEEVRLFGVDGTVECASCHREHGDVVTGAEPRATAYLRIDNAGDALCLVCHRR